MNTLMESTFNFFQLMNKNRSFSCLVGPLLMIISYVQIGALMQFERLSYDSINSSYNRITKLGFYFFNYMNYIDYSITGQNTQIEYYLWLSNLIQSMSILSYVIVFVIGSLLIYNFIHTCKYNKLSFLFNNTIPYILVVFVMILTLPINVVLLSNIKNTNSTIKLVINILVIIFTIILDILLTYFIFISNVVKMQTGLFYTLYSNKPVLYFSYMKWIVFFCKIIMDKNKDYSLFIFILIFLILIKNIKNAYSTLFSVKSALFTHSYFILNIFLLERLLSSILKLHVRTYDDLYFPIILFVYFGVILTYKIVYQRLETICLYTNYEDLKSKNDILTYIQSIRLVLLNKDLLSENIYFKGFINHYRKNNKHLDNISDDKLDIYILRDIFNYFYPTMYNNYNFHFQFLFFNIFQLKNYQLAIAELEKTKLHLAKDITTSQKFVLYQLRQYAIERISSDNISQGLYWTVHNMNLVVQYNNLIDELKNKIFNCMNVKKSIWENLSKDIIISDDLFDNAVQLYELKLEIKEIWEEISNSSDKDIDMPYVHLYSRFLKTVCLQESDSENIVNNRPLITKITNDELFNNKFKTDSGLIIINTFSENQIGLIKYANNAVADILGYSNRSDVIGSKINDHQPHIISSVHDTILHEYFIKSDHDITKKTIKTLAMLSKDKYLVPVSISFGLLPNIEQSINGIGIIRKRKSEEIIICNYQGEIDSITPKVGELFALTPSMLEKENYFIYHLFPELIKSSSELFPKFFLMSNFKETKVDYKVNCHTNGIIQYNSFNKRNINDFKSNFSINKISNKNKSKRVVKVQSTKYSIADLGKSILSNREIHKIINLSENKGSFLNEAYNIKNYNKKESKKKIQQLAVDNNEAVSKIYSFNGKTAYVKLRPSNLEQVASNPVTRKIKDFYTLFYERVIKKEQYSIQKYDNDIFQTMFTIYQNFFLSNHNLIYNEESKEIIITHMGMLITNSKIPVRFITFEISSQTDKVDGDSINVFKINDAESNIIEEDDKSDQKNFTYNDSLKDFNGSVNGNFNSYDLTDKSSLIEKKIKSDINYNKFLGVIIISNLALVSVVFLISIFLIMRYLTIVNDSVNSSFGLTHNLLISQKLIYYNLLNLQANNYYNNTLTLGISNDTLKDYLSYNENAYKGLIYDKLTIFNDTFMNYIFYNSTKADLINDLNSRKSFFLPILNKSLSMMAHIINTDNVYTSTLSILSKTILTTVKSIYDIPHLIIKITHNSMYVILIIDIIILGVVIVVFLIVLILTYKAYIAKRNKSIKILQIFNVIKPEEKKEILNKILLFEVKHKNIFKSLEEYKENKIINKDLMRKSNIVDKIEQRNKLNLIHKFIDLRRTVRLNKKPIQNEDKVIENKDNDEVKALQSNRNNMIFESPSITNSKLSKGELNDNIKSNKNYKKSYINTIFTLVFYFLALIIFLTLSLFSIYHSCISKINLNYDINYNLSLLIYQSNQITSEIVSQQSLINNELPSIQKTQAFNKLANYTLYMFYDIYINLSSEYYSNSQDMSTIVENNLCRVVKISICEESNVLNNQLSAILEKGLKSLYEYYINSIVDITRIIFPKPEGISFKGKARMYLSNQNYKHLDAILNTIRELYVIIINKLSISNDSMISSNKIIYISLIVFINSLFVFYIFYKLYSLFKVINNEELLSNKLIREIPKSILNTNSQLSYLIMMEMK